MKAIFFMSNRGELRRPKAGDPLHAACTAAGSRHTYITVVSTSYAGEQGRWEQGYGSQRTRGLGRSAGGSQCRALYVQVDGIGSECVVIRVG